MMYVEELKVSGGSLLSQTISKAPRILLNHCIGLMHDLTMQYAACVCSQIGHYSTHSKRLKSVLKPLSRNLQTSRKVDRKLSIVNVLGGAIDASMYNY